MIYKITKLLAILIGAVIFGSTVIWQFDDIQIRREALIEQHEMDQATVTLKAFELRGTVKCQPE